MTFEGWRDDLAAHQRAALEHQREVPEWERAAAAELMSVARDAVAALREAALEQVPVHLWVWRQPTPRELRNATRYKPAYPQRLVTPTILGSAWALELPRSYEDGSRGTQVFLLTEAGLTFSPMGTPEGPPARAGFWAKEPFWPEGPFYILEDMSASSAHDFRSISVADLKEAVIHTLRTYAA